MDAERPFVEEDGRSCLERDERDDVFGDAAKLAYYFLLALFPLLIFLTSAIGLIVGSGTRHAAHVVSVPRARDAVIGVSVDRFDNVGSHQLPVAPANSRLG